MKTNTRELFRFQGWEVYQCARTFRSRILRELIPKLPRQETFELASQLRRALASILLNLAEGAYRMSDRDFAVFLNRAGGSSYEVAAILDCCLDDGYVSHDTHRTYQEQLQTIIQQIGAFQKYVTHRGRPQHVA